MLQPSTKHTHIIDEDVATIANILNLIDLGHYRVALATLNLGYPCYISSDVIGEC